MADLKQKSLASFFSGGKRGRDEAEVEVVENKKKKDDRHRKYLSKWEKDYSWLRFDTEKNLMFCKFCEAVPSIAKGTDFITGCSSFKKETLKKHSDSSRHKSARDSVVGESKGYSVKKRIEGMNEKKDEKTLADMFIKFNTAYFIAKEELPFTKFRPLLDLETKNGLVVEPIYANDVKCAEIIECISSTMKDELADKLRESEFYSVIIDAGTDSSVTENEVVNVRYVHDGVAETSLLGIISLQHCDAQGTVAAIQEAFTKADLGTTFQNHIVGFCADGASVNFGQNTGVAARLTDDCPWLVSIWCLPHRLELAVMTLLKDSNLAAKVRDVLHLVYKTYHYSPKSRRELRTLASELHIKIKTPTRVLGTRWSPHMEKALKILMLPQTGKSLDDEGQYAVVLHHMEHLSSTSRNADIKGRATNLVKTMKTFNFVAFCQLMMDILKVVASLSLTLQANKTILPVALSSIKSTINELESLRHHVLGNGNLKSFLQHISSQHLRENVCFQGVSLTRCPDSDDINNLTMDSMPLEFRRSAAGAIQLITEGMRKRYKSLVSDSDEMQSKVVKAFSVFYHDSWPENANDLSDYGNEDIDLLVTCFGTVLERNGYSCNNISNQWNKLKTLISSELMDKSFQSLWKMMLTKEPYNDNYKEILQLVKIMLVIPTSSAQCERTISALNRIKSDVRSCLKSQTVETLIRISSEGPVLAQFQPQISVKKWFSVPRSIEYTAWPSSDDEETILNLYKKTDDESESSL